jgi:hypothetical protein
MAPEWTHIVDSNLEKQTSAFESLKKLDIYALGIILADLVCNPSTGMESMRIDESLKGKPPTLPKGYLLDDLVEGQLLLRLVSEKP